MKKNHSDRYDEELILKIQSGNKEAFAELYRSYFYQLCDFANRYVDTPSVCEELVQDVFLKIWLNRKQTELEGSPRSYLYRAVKNRALDYLKHLAIEREYLNRRRYEDSDRPLHVKYDYQPNHNPYEDDYKLARAIDDAINRLPDRRKMIFKLSREDGLTYREIADILGISIKTVETQMGRSLKTLSTLLSEYLPGLTVLYHHLQNWF